MVESGHVNELQWVTVRLDTLPEDSQELVTYVAAKYGPPMTLTVVESANKFLVMIESNPTGKNFFYTIFEYHFLIIMNCNRWLNT